MEGFNQRHVAKEMRFAPAERVATAVVWATVGASGLWYGIAAKSVMDMLLMMAIGSGAISMGALSLRRYATFDQRHGIDVSGLRKRSFHWEEVVDIHVGRPPGFRSGYCIVLTLKDRSELALLGTRAYSLLPSAKHHQQLISLARALKIAFRPSVGDSGR